MATFGSHDLKRSLTEAVIAAKERKTEGKGKGMGFGKDGNGKGKPTEIDDFWVDSLANKSRDAARRIFKESSDGAQRL